MASTDNRYSRFIALAKIVLPLAALGLLSTLFLFSHRVDPTRPVREGNVDVGELAREQRITAPTYSGVTRDGTAISISAATATPDLAAPGRGSAAEMTARLDFADGDHAEIASARGAVDTEAGHAILSGGVKITTTSGFEISTESLTAALDRTSVVSESTVNAKGPMGTLTAGQMRIEASGADDGGYVLLFKQGVKLVYHPGT
ncbi:MAG: hypothetical protein WCD16_16550 [Paracoccaceae bacterium]